MVSSIGDRRIFRIKGVVSFMPNFSRGTVEAYIDTHSRNTEAYRTHCEECGAQFSVYAKQLYRRYLLKDRPYPCDKAWKPQPLCPPCWRNPDISRRYVRVIENLFDESCEDQPDLVTSKAMDIIARQRARASSPMMRRAIGRRIKFKVLNADGNLIDDEGCCLSMTYGHVILVDDLDTQDGAEATSRTYRTCDIVRESITFVIPDRGPLLNRITDTAVDFLSALTDELVGMDTTARVEANDPLRVVKDIEIEV